MVFSCRRTLNSPALVRRYEWLKNGILIPPGPNILFQREGVVQIKPLTSLDEGYYQCRATNAHGTALSNVTLLQRAVLQTYGAPIVEDKYGLLEGQPFKISYVPTKCVPRPRFNWGVAKDVVDVTQVGVVTDERVQIDDEGMDRLSCCDTTAIKQLRVGIMCRRCWQCHAAIQLTMRKTSLGQMSLP